MFRFELNEHNRGEAFYPTEEETAQWAGMYETEETPVGDKTLYARYSIGTFEWFVAEIGAYGEDGTMMMFGWACLGDPSNAEWGYTDLSELEGITEPVVVRRDYGFVPGKAREILPAAAWAWGDKE